MVYLAANAAGLHQYGMEQGGGVRPVSLPDFAGAHRLVASRDRQGVNLGGRASGRFPDCGSECRQLGVSEHSGQGPARQGLDGEKPPGRVAP
jgi:hypothetical protein